jgi:thiol-disulfide isomerase/thioredoxin
MFYQSKSYFITFLTALCFLISSLAWANSSDNMVDEFSAKLATHTGKVVYVDFWASWCGPCRKSFPWMNKMQKAHKDLKVISINLDEDKELAEEFLVNYPAQFEVVFDQKGKLASEFKIKGMPSSFIINKQGRIVSAHVGFTLDKQKEYEQEIVTLLKSSK